jgi:hypothetical protein
MASSSLETIMETAIPDSAWPTWHYLPTIEYGEKVQSYGGGAGLRVVYYNNLRSTGAIQYRFLATVYAGDTMFPLFMVAAEQSDLLALRGEWALGVFRPDGHQTIDISEDYGNWYSFHAAALLLIDKEFPSQGSTPPETLS